MNIEDIHVEASTPPEELIRRWLKANEGRVDGDTVVIKMAGLQALLGHVTKAVVKCVAAAVNTVQEEEEADEKARSPNDPNLQALTELAKIADTLVTMRDGFKAGDEGWKPLVAAIEATLADVSRALVVACGRDA